MSFKEYEEYKESDYTIQLPEGIEIKQKFVKRMVDDILMIDSPKKENERLKNLLTACYNCETMKEVKKLIEAEIAGEEV